MWYCKGNPLPLKRVNERPFLMFIVVDVVATTSQLSAILLKLKERNIANKHKEVDQLVSYKSRIVRLYGP